MDIEKKIILDADVLIHFFKGGILHLLPSIYPDNEFIICDILLEYEILPGELNDLLQDLIEMDEISVVEMEMHDKYLEILIEFGELKKQFGKGESACMAYCRYSNDVVGSSNLSDIINYCQSNSIEFITTMGFIKAAYNSKILTKEECNAFVKTNIDQGSRLPCKTFTEFLNKKMSY